MKQLTFEFKKKMRQLSVAFILLTAGSSYAFAQGNGWIFGLHTSSNNFYTANVLGIAEFIANAGLVNVTKGNNSWNIYALNLHYLKMKDNGEEISFASANPYGFTAYDLFNDIECGLKFGWQGAESPIGAYLYGAYSLSQYKLRFLGEHEYSKHRFHSIHTGIRVRISPLRFLEEEHGWCPIVELGTTYVYNFKYKGPNDSNVDQINNGMRTYYALGVHLESGVDVMLGFDMMHYDMFNKNYTPDNGFWYPYANFKNNDYNFSLKVSCKFGYID